MESVVDEGSTFTIRLPRAGGSNNIAQTLLEITTMPNRSRQPDSENRPEKALPKSVLAKLTQIGEPTRSIFGQRLRELKPKNAREALQRLNTWEGLLAELALTEPLNERERKDQKALEAKAAALARRVVQ